MTVARVGQGFDVHALVSGRRLIIGGVDIPYERGLDGHSDADVLLHAICDALLSAAGLGDVGTIFGIDRPEWAGASGVKMLSHVRDLLVERGFSINNVSLVIVGNEPKISKRRHEAQELLTNLLQAPVSLSATTTDGMGFTGRGEGISVTATALVVAS